MSRMILMRFAGDNDFINSVEPFGRFVQNAIEYRSGEDERMFDPTVLQDLWRTIGKTMYRVYQSDSDKASWDSFGDLEILVDDDAKKKLESYSAWSNHDGVLLVWDPMLGMTFQIV